MLLLLLSLFLLFLVSWNVIVYLAVISVVDGVVFGSDGTVVPTLVATVVAVIDGMLLSAHVEIAVGFV